METVGFVGLGNMGSVLAANLVQQGYSVVAHDALCPERVPEGAVPACDVADLARRADVVVLSLPASAASEQVTGALLAEDPDARVVPYCLSAGTDAKSFSRLGIRCFGFTPLQLPADLDFSGMFHGIDERVPVDALRFGVRVLDRFLDLC